MVSWDAFAAAAPVLAEAGRRLIYRTATGEALLASVRGDEPPRIHPIYVALLDGRLYAFLSRSAKATDLATDGRYALHTHQDPAVPSEFMVRGRVRVVGDATEIINSLPYTKRLLRVRHNEVAEPETREILNHIIESVKCTSP